MKKLILAVFLCILLAVAPVNAAVYYVDLISGNDSTGTGTTGAPWKTVDKCTTSGATTGGDECRLAKMTPTTLSGTLTFTNGSASVGTSVDLTGSLSAGDVIGKNTTNEGWWQITSLTSSTITLDYVYWGTSETTTGYKANFFTATDDSHLDINASGTSQSSMLKISGGWDLTGPTQDGLTFIDAVTYSSPSASSIARNFVEISNIVQLVNSALQPHGFINYFHNSVIKNFYLIEPYSFIPADLMMLDHVVFAGGGATAAALSLSSSGRNVYLKDVYMYSAGTGLNDRSLNASNCNTIFVDGLYIYNSYDDAIYLSLGTLLIGTNVVIDTTNYSTSADGMYADYDSKIMLSGVTVSNVTGYSVKLASHAGRNSSITDIVFTNSGLADVDVYGSNSSIYEPVLSIHNYNGTPNDDRIYFSTESVTYRSDPGIVRDTTDARSGSCLKFTPRDSDYFINYKVGSYKVTNAASNLILSVYMKDDASFDGYVRLIGTIDNKTVSVYEDKVLTTSYARYDFTIPTADLTVGDWADLYVLVTGANGSIFVDDFEVRQ